VDQRQKIRHCSFTGRQRRRREASWLREVNSQKNNLLSGGRSYILSVKGVGADPIAWKKGTRKGGRRLEDRYQRNVEEGASHLENVEQEADRADLREADLSCRKNSVGSKRGG